jgi:hypothetical protein
MEKNDYQPISLSSWYHMKGVVLILVQLILFLMFFGMFNFQFFIAPKTDWKYAIPFLLGIAIYAYINNIFIKINNNKYEKAKEREIGEFEEKESI